jgi:hypothetical protein
VELALSSNTALTTGGELGRNAVSSSTRYEDGFTYYRPELEMMVTGFSVSRDEWGAAVDWTLTLEEI